MGRPQARVQIGPGVLACATHGGGQSKASHCFHLLFGPGVLACAIVFVDCFLFYCPYPFLLGIFNFISFLLFFFSRHVSLGCLFEISGLSWTSTWWYVSNQVLFFFFSRLPLLPWFHHLSHLHLFPKNSQAFSTHHPSPQVLHYLLDSFSPCLFIPLLGSQDISLLLTFLTFFI